MEQRTQSFASSRDPGKKCELGMIKTVDQLEKLLANESLTDLNILSLEIPQHVEKAFAIEVSTNALQMWTTLRRLLPQIGMWPVLYTFWGNPRNSWEEYVKANDTFLRRPFEWETPEDKDSSPDAIVARAELTSFEGLLESHANMYSENLHEDYAFSLQKTKQRFNAGPPANEVKALIMSEKIKNYVELEKWLLDWELRHIPAKKSLPPDDTHYFDWYVPLNEPQALILLPTMNSWETLAFIHWHGAETCGTETAIAMLRWWREKYGAELVAHYGTMLHIAITRRPSSIEEAFRLAWEQEA